MEPDVPEKRFQGEIPSSHSFKYISKWNYISCIDQSPIAEICKFISQMEYNSQVDHFPAVKICV